MSGLSAQVVCSRVQNKVIKVQVSMCLISYDTQGSVGIAPPFFTSALVGGEWSASRPGSFTPWEIVSSARWIRRQVGHRAGLDAVKMIINLIHHHAMKTYGVEA
jgi:hypothetical protein